MPPRSTLYVVLKLISLIPRCPTYRLIYISRFLANDFNAVTTLQGQDSTLTLHMSLHSESNQGTARVVAWAFRKQAAEQVIEDLGGKVFERPGRRESATSYTAAGGNERTSVTDSEAEDGSGSEDEIGSESEDEIGRESKTRSGSESETETGSEFETGSESEDRSGSEGAGEVKQYPENESESEDEREGDEVEEEDVEQKPEKEDDKFVWWEIVEGMVFEGEIEDKDNPHPMVEREEMLMPEELLWPEERLKEIRQLVDIAESDSDEVVESDSDEVLDSDSDEVVEV